MGRKQSDCQMSETRHRSAEADSPMNSDSPTKEETNGHGHRSVSVKGLPNLGNTCFFNSVTQCLLQTHALYKWQEMVTEKTEFHSKPGPIVISEKKVDVPEMTVKLEDTYMALINALQNFIVEFRSDRSPSPSHLFSQIAQKAPRFRGWAQQDAHELLRYLLDGIRTEELKRFKDAIDRELGIVGKDPEKALLSKAILESGDRCFVDSIFGGNLLQVIICSNCHHVSSSLEPFLDLSLPLNYGPPAPAISVPRNRREGSGGLSRHQQKKARKEAKKAARLARARHSDSEDPAIDINENNGGIIRNGLNELKPIDEDGGSSNESNLSEDYCSQSEPEEDEDEPMDHENSFEIPENQYRGPNYSAVLAPLPACDDHETRSVVNSLKQFTFVEHLFGKNAYECEHCCAPRNKKLGPKDKKVTKHATKRYLVYSPPAVLTLHLKRFEQVPLGYGIGCRMRTKKIRGHVEFPFLLDMAPFCSQYGQRIAPGQKRVLYSLYGIVSHSGDLGGGHYVAYVKSRTPVDSLMQYMKAGMTPDRLCKSIEELQRTYAAQEIHPAASEEEILKQLDRDSCWYYASDSHVRTSNREDVEHVEAYILFYERIL